MYGTAQEVIDLSGIDEHDFGLETEEDLVSLLEAWLVRITDLINVDRRRNFELEDPRWTQAASFAGASGGALRLLDGTAFTAQEGSWEIDGDGSGSPVSVEAIATVPSGSDQFVGVSASLGDDLVDGTPGSVGVVLGFTDVDNYVRVVITRDDDLTWGFVVEQSAAVDTVLAAFPVSDPTPDSYDLRAALVSGAVSVWVNGRLRVEAVPVGGSVGSAVGVYADHLGVSVSSFSAGGPGPVPSGVTAAALQMATQLVNWARASRHGQVIRVDDFEVGLAEVDLFSAEVRRTLRRYPAKSNLRLSVVGALDQVTAGSLRGG